MSTGKHRHGHAAQGLRVSPDRSDRRVAIKVPPGFKGIFILVAVAADVNIKPAQRIGDHGH